MSSIVVRTAGASLPTIALALLLSPIVNAQNATTSNATAPQDTTGAIGSYAQLDADQDQALTEDEFRPYVDQTYDAWDTNADDLLDDQEFARGVFGTWDADKDTIVTRDEYDRGYASWFEDIEVEGDAGYEALAERESQLMEETFADAAGDLGLYEAWTGSAEPVDRDTFARTLFERIAGDDAELTEAEFERLQSGG